MPTTLIFWDIKTFGFRWFYQKHYEKEGPEVNDHISGSQNSMFRLRCCVDCQQEYTHLCALRIGE